MNELQVMVVVQEIRAKVDLRIGPSYRHGKYRMPIYTMFSEQGAARQ